TVMARGFHPGPVFGIFGAAVAAAKVMRFTEDQVNSTIALCASLAASNPEAARSGGRALREGAAVRNAMLAVALAKQGHVGAEHDIQPKDIDRVEAVVNWLETQYPSPAFPSRREDQETRPGSTAYFSAYGAATRGFPVARGIRAKPTGADDPLEVLELMKRVT